MDAAEVEDADNSITVAVAATIITEDAAAEINGAVRDGATAITAEDINASNNLNNSQLVSTATCSNHVDVGVDVADAVEDVPNTNRTTILYATIGSITEHVATATTATTTIQTTMNGTAKWAATTEEKHRKYHNNNSNMQAPLLLPHSQRTRQKKFAKGTAK